MVAQSEIQAIKIGRAQDRAAASGRPYRSTLTSTA
jgi:hypothetical protein